MRAREHGQRHRSALNEKPRHEAGLPFIYCSALAVLALLATLTGLVIAALLLLARLLAAALLLAGLLTGLIALLLLARFLIWILVLVLTHPEYLQTLMAFVARSVPSRLSGQ